MPPKKFQPGLNDLAQFSSRDSMPEKAIPGTSPKHFRWVPMLSVALGFFLCLSSVRADDTRGPGTLLIDDFSGGTSKWESKGVGTLSIGEGSAPGRKAMVWSADSDGMGHIALRDLTRDKIDFSQYDLLIMSMKFDGKPIWSLNPILQQAPAVYGFRANYWSLSTLSPYNRWFTFTQDLRRWANAWPDSYNAKAQEFEFEVHQLAGPGKTRISIEKVLLVKCPIDVPFSVPGRWNKMPDGSQESRFEIPVQNRGAEAIAVTAEWGDGVKPDGIKLEIPASSLMVAPGTSGTLVARGVISPTACSSHPAFFGDVFKLAVKVKEIPELVRYTELAVGTMPAKRLHPSIITTPEKMAELQKTYNDPASRRQLGKPMLALIASAEKSLSYKAQYPPNAATGRSTDPVSSGKLVKIDVPNLPFNVYQDPVSGRTYSGPLYDAAVLDWLGIHMRNSAVAKSLALGYLLTGRKDMAEAAASIFREYVVRYPKLPFIPYDPGSPAGNKISGTTRIGGTFMRERVWLTNLAIALDSIIPSGVLSKQEIADVATQIFEPSANGMMDHKVGVMNLQWMVQSAALYAGLATESPSLVSRAVYDSHGIDRLIATGFLRDGQWWENDSYQNVCKLAAYPALVTAVYNGIIPWNERFSKFFLSSYRLYGPDTHGPTLGTGGWASYALDDDAITALAGMIKSPEVAWAAYHRPGGKAVNTDIGLMAAFRNTKPLVPEAETRSPIPTETTKFPDYGGIALRIPGTDQYCYFHYGRELVHGHRNKLSINAYGAGGWYVRNVMGGYEHNFKNFLETIASASTVMVDGSNSDADTGELTFHRSIEGAELASGRTSGAYKGVEHERSLVLTRHGLVVIDRLLSQKDRTYDWLWHGSHCGLEITCGDVGPALSPRLGESSLYESLKVTGAIKTDAHVDWVRKDKSGMVQAFLPKGEMNLLQVDQAYKPHQSLNWRQKAANASYAAALAPYRPGEKPAVAICNLEVRNVAGQPASLEQGQAVEVTYPGERLTILVNYSGKPLKAGMLTSSERVSIFSAK